MSISKDLDLRWPKGFQWAWSTDIADSNNQAVARGAAIRIAQKERETMGAQGSGRHSYEDVVTCFELQQSGYYDECRCARYHSWELFVKMGFAPDDEEW